MNITHPSRTVPASAVLGIFMVLALTACPPSPPSNNDGGGGNGCPEATSGCPCAAAGRCDTGLTCTNNVCTATSAAPGVQVSHATVRSCDLLLAIPNASTIQVVYASSVIGKSRAKDNKLGLSFVAKGDAALTSVAELKDANGQPLPLAGVTITESTCYGRLGTVVAGPSVTLN